MTIPLEALFRLNDPEGSFLLNEINGKSEELSAYPTFNF